MRAAAVSFDGEVVLAEAQRLPTGLSIDPCESLSGLEWGCDRLAIEAVCGSAWEGVPERPGWKACLLDGERAAGLLCELDTMRRCEARLDELDRLLSAERRVDRGPASREPLLLGLKVGEIRLLMGSTGCVWNPTSGVAASLARFGEGYCLVLGELDLERGAAFLGECAARRRSVGFEAAIADPNTTFCDAEEFWDALGPTFDRLAAIDGPWVNPRTDGAFGSPVPLVSDRLRRAGRTGEAVRLSRAALDAARRCSTLPARDGLER